MKDEREIRVFSFDSNNSLKLFRTIFRRPYRHERSSESRSSCDSTSTGGSDGSIKSEHMMYKSASSLDLSSQEDKDRSDSLNDTFSVRKMIQLLRRNSMQNMREQENKTSKRTPKKILRSPQTYKYVRGMSGIPIRQPTTPACCGDFHSQDMHWFNGYSTQSRLQVW